MTMTEPMKLTADALRSMSMAKVFKQESGRINSIDFHRDGGTLIVGDDNDDLRVYNTETGKQNKVVHNKKYGIDLVRFTHHHNSVLCASKNKWDDTIRYLSLHDNAYLRYFKGHRDRVVSLEMHPDSDLFLSSSDDRTVRLWDVRVPACQGLMHADGRSVVAFDPQGMVFSVACPGNILKMYDARKYSSGPFDTFCVAHAPVRWAGVKFSPDGQLVLLSTFDNVIFLLDSFSGKVNRTFTSHVNEAGLQLEASFSADGEFVLSGSEDGTIHIWSVKSGIEETVLQGHSEAVGAVRFNPNKMMIASGCQHLAFWLPQKI